MELNNEWGTIYDYLNWWGNLTFQQVPFNDIDSLILSEISYVECDGYIQEGMTLEELSLCCHESSSNQKTEFSLIGESTQLLQILKDYKRFQSIKILNYCNDIDYKIEKQFSAMTFILENDYLYIAFRGTDDTILGWKEDFNMIYQENVPSQIEAASYTKKMIHQYKKILNRKGKFFKYPQIYLGGHSKGGNLAIYAAANLEKKTKKHLMMIYNFDGPGFTQSFLKNSNYQDIKDKVITYRPTGSVIGGLLNHDCQEVYVSSFSNNMMQHSGFTWKVKENKFKICDQLDRQNQKINEDIMVILETMSKEKKESFVQEFFDLLDYSDIKRVSDITENKLNKLMAGMKGFKNMSSDNRTLAFTLFKYMLLLQGKHFL